MNGRDVGMVEFGESQSLFAEPGTSGFIGQRACGKHLQRHIPIKPLIMGAIDDSHAACTNLLDYAVMSQYLPNAGGGN